MSKPGLAIMIADKMPPPGKRKGAPADDYGDDGGDSSDSGDDEDMELSTMADFRQCLKSGDDEGALGHLRDLVDMLSQSGEKDDAG